MSDYAIADLHFGHKGILEIRPEFSSLEEMENALIKNWNATVLNDSDTVYVVGDFQLYKKDMGIFNSLRGRKILIVGNHDHTLTRSFGWESMHDILTVMIDGHEFILCHYPMESWKNSRHGSIHVHGHTHLDNILDLKNRHIVCVEHTGYSPVDLRTLIGAHDYRPIDLSLIGADD